MYVITPHTYKQAKKLGLTVQPSKKANKKIDVYKDGQYIDSVGQTGYKDYGMYLQEDKTLAETRRRLYYQRHTQDTQREHLASLLLW